MKYIKPLILETKLYTINELFNSNTKSDSTIIKTTLNKSSLFNGALIDILINDIPYRFTTQVKKFHNGTYIYIAYKILQHQDFISDKSKKNDLEYDFIVNKSMMIDVLNTLPLFLEEYKKILLENGINTKIDGFYYDSDSNKRKNIYYYYFTNKLGNRLKHIDTKDSFFIFIQLKEPVKLENLYL